MRDPAAAAHLFDIVSDALPADQAGRTGITVYDTANRPLAWAGRVIDLAKQRVSGPAALFVAPGALGPRLVRVEPVVDPNRPGSLRDATIVVEQSLAGLQPTPGLAADTAVVSTSLAPVTIRPRSSAVQGPPGDRRLATGNYAFVIPSRTGGLLVEAEVSRAALTEARARWRARTWAACVLVLVLTLSLCAGPLLDLRRRVRTAGVFLAATASVAIILLAARAVLLWVAASVAGPQPFGSPANALLTALTAAAFVGLAVDVLARRRVAKPRPRLWLRNDPHAIGDYRVAGVYFVTGALAAFTLAVYERFLQRIVAQTDLDVLHFSLHPFSIQGLEVGFGLVLLHAAVIWGAAMAAHAGGVFWRRPRRWDLRATATIGWLAGAAAAVGVMVNARTDSIPLLPWCVSLAACGACAARSPRLSRRSRRASQAARLVALFAALVVPAIAMYPSLFFYATAAKEHLIATTYAPQATSQRKDLKDRLYQTLDQIDAMPALADFVAFPATVAAPTIDRAFAVWSNTALATYRLTSSIELYGRDGGLVSRFALLPEYTTPRHEATSCNWELFEEVLPFGATERHVPQASRGICERGVIRGAIVVRVMLDYRTLPFISSQNPYLESLRPERAAAPEGLQGNDIEFVGYGWSRAPQTTCQGRHLAAARRCVRARGRLARIVLDDAAARRRALSRLPDERPRRHLRARLPVADLVRSSRQPRGARRARGSPVRDPADRGGALRLHCLDYAGERPGAAPRVSIELLSQAVPRVRSRSRGAGGDSRVRRADLLCRPGPGVEEAAATTATVAQRLVEDYATLQQLDPAAPAPIDDQIMVLVSRAIDQDVNLFDRSSLEATSQRDLFASRLLSPRTPSLVYRRIVLERLPTFVSTEQLANSSYLEAAAPIRAGGREGIVTVPLPLRKLEIERQIDTLDRQVVFGAVLFSLLGAGLGYWMAERIADPINRLSHATRRIARGDLNAHIAVASADELGRLVEDFNRMADDLKRQRRELERTQRLEAWADMARQVAHDIKNPLTPIQLSAEHARRVNIDRGRPLSPVLDDCVTRDPHPGDAAAADLGRVLQLRLVADRAPSPRRCRRSSKKSWRPIARGWQAASASRSKRPTSFRSR